MTERKPTIAIITDRYFSYQADILESLATELNSAGFGTLCITGKELSAPESRQSANSICNTIYSQINSFNVSGIISLSGTIGHGVSLDTVTRFLTGFDSPLISFGINVPGVRSVFLDEVSGMSDLMDHLLSDPTRQQFAFVRGHENDPYSMHREKIFRDALTQKGFDPSQMYYVNGDYSPFDTYELITALLANHKIDCIVAANDVMAASAARAAKAQGLLIPHDIAVSGFDDTSDATGHSPAISTVRQPLNKMSHKTVELLLEEISGKHAEHSQHSYCFPTELIVRRSTQSTQSALKLTNNIDEPTLRTLLSQLLHGLEVPENITMQDISVPLWNAIEYGSPDILYIADGIDDITLSKHSHWWTNLTDQVQSINNTLEQDPARKQNIPLISAAASKVKERIWSIEMDRLFESQRLQNYRSDFQLALSSCNDVEDIQQAMHVWLDNLKPNRCFLVRYKQKGPKPDVHSEIVFTYTKGKNNRTRRAEFNSSDVLPKQFQHELSTGLLIMTPLYSDKILYGYLLIEPSDTKLLYTEAAAHSIGNAMRTHYHMATLQSQKTSLEFVNTELAHLANHDALTGLANRLQFQQYLDECIETNSAETDLGFLLLFIDLDGFKLVNDTLGHNAGDLLLNKVAQRLIDTVEHSVEYHGFISRLGGDEFTVILHPNRRHADTSLITASILKALSSPYEINQTNVSISASIGCVLYPDNATNNTNLVQHADSAMYKAKQSGKNSIVFFSDEMVNEDDQGLKLMQELRVALQNKQLQMYYQPRVDMQTGKMRSVEALMRWLIPGENGLQARARPDEFIPLAEKVGLISQLDTYALNYSCKQAAQWASAGTPLTVSVNVSVHQLQQSNFVDTIKSVLQKNRLDPRLLELEITESAAMTDVESNILKLSQLKSLGIKFSIDDFGTGYSSLNYLKRLPVDHLKIDRSFLTDITQSDGGNSADAAIVRSVVALGKSMGFGLVAEGIETKEQAIFIDTLGCEEAQGYLYSQPVCASDITQMLTDNIQFMDTDSKGHKAA